MSFSFDATEGFYPGEQRIHLMADAVLRRVFLVIFGNMAIGCALALFIEGPRREMMYIGISLFYIIPALMRMTGGFPKEALPWYAGLCISYLAGITPAILFKFYYTLPVCALSILFYVRMMHAAPRLADALGYFEKPVRPLPETGYGLGVAGIFIFISFFFFPAAGFKFTNHGFGGYATLAATGLLTYGFEFGIIYGIVTRRLMALRSQLMLMIVMNSTLLTLTWTSAYIGGPRSFALNFLLGAGPSIFTALTQTLAFYYCRSTRMLLFSYILLYLVYKSFI